MVHLRRSLAASCWAIMVTIPQLANAEHCSEQPQAVLKFEEGFAAATVSAEVRITEEHVIDWIVIRPYACIPWQLLSLAM